MKAAQLAGLNLGNTRQCIWTDMALLNENYFHVFLCVFYF